MHVVFMLLVFFPASALFFVRIREPLTISVALVHRSKVKEASTPALLPDLRTYHISRLPLYHHVFYALVDILPYYQMCAHVHS